jgi:hypothetical protein
LVKNTNGFKTIKKEKNVLKQSNKLVKNGDDELIPSIKPVKSSNLDKINLINDKYTKQLKIYKTIKTSLKSIVKNEDILLKINLIVCRMNKIIIHVYNFLKLFILEHYYTKKQLPVIDQFLIVMIIKTICTADGRGRKFSTKNKDLRDQLEAFHEKYYKPLMIEKPSISYTNLSQMIEYEATSIITALSNHVQEHFEDFVNRMVNIYYKKKQFVEENKNNREKINEFFTPSHI